MARCKTVKYSSKAQKLSKTVTDEAGRKAGTDTLRPVWSFSEVDRGGEFAFDARRISARSEFLLAKFIDYSTMTWAEIKRQTHNEGKSKHHYIEYDRLSSEAQKRLSLIGKDNDSDNVFSLAFDSLLRIIGIRRGERFCVLWYDPEHRVCPSIKKHT